MPLIFHYLLQLFLTGFFKVVGVFLGLFFLIDGVESIRRFSQKANFNWVDITLLMVFRIPAFVTKLLPSIALLTTLLVLTLLSRQNEITVMRASGISLHRILIPFLLGGVIIAALHVIFQDQIVPRTNRMAQQQEDIVTNRKRSPGSETGNLWLRSGRQIIHAQQVMFKQRVLLAVTVFRFDDNHHLTSRLEAGSAELTDNKWELVDGMIYRFGKVTDAQQFARQKWDVGIRLEQLHRQPENTAFLSGKEMLHVVQRMESEGYDATRFLVRLHSRLAHPVTTLAAILLAFPFALRLPRQGGVTGSVLIGLLLGFSMFVVITLSTSLGVGGRLPPLLAAWAPVLFFTGIGGFLLFHLAEPRRGG